jgi:succinate dehydrogenase / fumarate reductase membrane anchor subunit
VDRQLQRSAHRAAERGSIILKKALSGLRAWLMQRFTAVYMLLFFMFALLHFIVDPPHSYFDWRDWITGPFVLIATALFFVSLLLHAWVGLRDVMIDYVHPLPLRVALLASLSIILAGLALWVTQILLWSQR